MKTLANGMEELPEAFVKKVADPYSLEDDIHYGIIVRKVERREHGCGKRSCAVKVSGRQTQTGNEVDFHADAVILTIPLNIMRQVEFSPSLPQDVNDAIGGIRYGPSTKIFLGFRERFWEKGKYPIVDGGISRTDLPISQIVYPSKETCDDKSKRGVLLLYTWNKEALLFSSQPQDEALTEACVRSKLFTKAYWTTTRLGRKLQIALKLVPSSLGTLIRLQKELMFTCFHTATCIICVLCWNPKKFVLFSLVVKLFLLQMVGFKVL